MKLISIGFGSFVSAARIIAVVDPDSNPVKRVAAQAKEDGRLIDATYGRKTESVLIMDNGSVILCALSPEAVADRAAQREGGDGRES